MVKRLTVLLVFLLCAGVANAQLASAPPQALYYLIPTLPPASLPLTGNEIILLIQNGQPVQATIYQILNNVSCPQLTDNAGNLLFDNAGNIVCASSVNPPSLMQLTDNAGNFLFDNAGNAVYGSLQ